MSECLYDPWPMRVITKPEAEFCYEQRKFCKRTGKEIAAEVGKAERSVERAISYIAMERGTYGYEAWRRELREYKIARCRQFLDRVRNRDRLKKIAVQSIEEHSRSVEVVRAALGYDNLPRAPKPTQKEVDALYMSGTVPIEISTHHEGNGERMGEAQRGGARSRSLSTLSERETRRRAKRLREMLGPTAMPHELGLPD
jgi:hypothetical protein